MNDDKQNFISNIQDGWMTLQIGNFKGKASYLKDTISDLFVAFTNYLCTSDPQIVEIDEENTGSAYIVLGDDVFVVKHDKVLCLDDHVNICDLCKQFLHDVENNIENIISEFLYCEPRYYKKAKRIIVKELKILQNLLIKGGNYAF